MKINQAKLKDKKGKQKKDYNKCQDWVCKAVIPKVSSADH